MAFLTPSSIALIGASAEEKKLGHYILKNLKDGGFRGKIFPVNPKHDELLGLPCFHAVADIPERVDMAVVVTPASTVSAVAEECGKKNVETLVVISAGFGEIGTEDGHAREAELLAIGKKYGMKIVGPNCLGVLRPGIGLNASFANTPKASGRIALVSQSGAMAVALLDRAEALHMNFSSVVSIGNKADLNESDFLDILENDKETDVIGLYLESIKDGARFIETAARVGKKKHIVLIKSGVSARGAKAVSSHTGALAGSTSSLGAACVKAGIHRAETTEEFMGLLATLSTQPTLASRSIAVITNAGGPGVLATDAAERAGLELTQLADATVDTLKKALPPAASAANPVDVLGDALSDRYAAALEACADDPNVDGLVLLLTPQVMTPCEDIAEAIVNVKSSHPLLPIVTAFMGGGSVADARTTLRMRGIPSFETPEEAVRALACLKKKNELAEVIEMPKDDDRSSGAAGLLKGKKGLLSEDTTATLFALYGLTEPDQKVAKHATDAAAIAATIGYPVIAKISSPDILHKTDIGGVRANLKTPEEVKRAYDEIMKNAAKAMPAAALNGVLIQQFLPVGNEFIVGAIRDPNFGPLVMVGLGGIYTELFRDTCFRIAPVSEEEAYDMLSSLKSWKLLLGMRGKGQLAIDDLAQAICKIGQLMHDCDDITEIDLNPVLVGEKSIIIADAKVVIG